ncbi:thiamine pyrophosphate-binding protein [Cycloclasticus sp. P1]|uniref:thiamine pyrophosphate-binding protein n=1 Tax=Cycloclasticus sp. (strain P1) TaxID=385025 RepID=UPI000286AC4C|nr:thiamine pyrophosphate-binding protein [Cycloclasticus sp. P1]AFT67459.1 Acetolactate synthase large subunit [Cycloclasticus sp. P1]
MSLTLTQAVPQNEIATCELLLDYLEKIGVEYVFGIPGGAIEPLYNALAKSEKRGGIKAITARHETGAVFMADAYARNTGKLGVCCSTTGPGATNMITGVASSFENNTPLLVITPQTSQDKVGKKAMQESGDTGVNVSGMFHFFTKYTSYVTDVEQFEHKLVSAIMSAFSSPGGPTHLSIPADILKSSVPIKQTKTNIDNLLRRPVLKDEEIIQDLLTELRHSKKIIFVIGAGTKNCSGLIAQCINELDIEFVATPDGKSFINPYHPSYRGVIGFAGHKSANRTLQNETVDTVVVIGSSLGEFTSNAWDQLTLLNNKLIHIDDNQENFTRSSMAKLQVSGHIPTILEAILENNKTRFPDNTEKTPDKSLIDKTKFFTHIQSDNQKLMHFEFDEPNKTTDASTPLKPQYLMTQLTRLFPPNTRYLADTGNNLAWSIHYLNPYDRRFTKRRLTKRGEEDRRSESAGLLQICAEFCSMGWSVGSAIGTSLAHPSDPVVCIVGDGSFLMSGNEITVALQEKLNIIFLVMNDQHLGMVKHGQRLNKSADIANTLPNISYALMASAMGIMSHTIETADDLLQLDTNKICERKGPTLLDIRIDAEEVPPIATRLKGMK